MNDSQDTFIGFLILLGIGLAIYYSIKKENKDATDFTNSIKKSIRHKSLSVINSHKEQLAIQRRKYVHIDSYGKENVKTWFEKEIPYFIESHIFPLLTIQELNNFWVVGNEIHLLIDSKSKQIKPKSVEFNENMNGFEFEDYCKQILESKGWKVEKTKNGADQGIDLIIQQKKRKIGVQCKKYSRPIGNKSVQEVKAGLNYYNLSEGVVLGNKTFTKSAINLGNANNIKLLHFLEIEKI